MTAQGTGVKRKKPHKKKKKGKTPSPSRRRQVKGSQGVTLFNDLQGRIYVGKANHLLNRAKEVLRR